MTDFDNNAHQIMVLTDPTDRATAESLPLSDGYFRAMQQAGLMDNIVASTTAPVDTTKLWLDKNVAQPHQLKVYDIVTSGWINATFDRVFMPARGEYHASWFGATSHGPLNNLITAVNSIGGGTVVLDMDQLDTTGNINMASGVHLKSTVGTLVNMTAGATVIQASGSLVTTDNNLFTSNALGETNKGTVNTIDVTDGSLFSEGDDVLLQSTGTMWTGNTQSIGEYKRVEAIAGNQLTLNEPLRYDYLTAENAEIIRVNWLDDASVEGIEFRYQDETISTNLVSALLFTRNFRWINCAAGNNRFTGFGLFGALDTLIDGCRAYDLISDTTNNYLGYGIAEGGLNKGTVITGFQADNVRHGYTTTGSAGLNARGVPEGTRVIGAYVRGPKLAGLDTHSEARDVGFIGCHVQGGLGPGVQHRGRDCFDVGCSYSNVRGAGVFITGNAIDCSTKGAKLRDTNLGTNTEDSIDWPNEGAITLRGTRDRASDFDINWCRGPGVKFESSSRDPVVQGGAITDPCRDGTTRYAVGMSAAPVTNVHVSQIEIRSSGTVMDYGIDIASPNITLHAQNGEINGAQIRKVQAHISHFVNDFDDVSLSSAGLPQSISVTAGGDLDMSAADAGTFVVVDATASTNIDNITNVTNGARIVLQRGAQNFTLRAVQGGDGQIVTPGFADLSATSSSHNVSVVVHDNLTRVVSSNI